MLPLRKYKCTPLKRPENTAFLAFLAMHTPLSDTSKQADFEAKKARILARGVHSLSLHFCMQKRFTHSDPIGREQWQCYQTVKSLTYDTL